jgi:SPP1 gp7 family putative phage head morphogenesis protein
MLSNNSKLLNSLKTISFNLAIRASDKYPGEAFHKVYKKYPDIFRQLIKADVTLEKAVRGYFKGLTESVNSKINWPLYQTRIHTASEIFRASTEDFIDADWEDETLTLRTIITPAMQAAILAGGQMTQLDTSIDVGWSATSAPALDFLNKYSLKLAGDLTATTLDNVKSSLALSMSLGESMDQASSRLSDVIDNDYRAAMIAHTESVRAFSEGRTQVGKEIGADRKQWSATADACPVCAELDGQVVGIDETFDDGEDSPPDHPNCRCLERILMPGEDKVDDNAE